jgi:hypothetical protein
MLTFDEREALIAVRDRKPLSERQRELMRPFTTNDPTAYVEVDEFGEFGDRGSLRLTCLGEEVVDRDAEPEFTEGGCFSFGDEDEI